MKSTWFYTSAAVLAFSFIWLAVGGPYIEWPLVAGISMLFTSSMIHTLGEQER